MALIGTTAYLANGSLGLKILDVSNPEKPILKATYDTPGYAVNLQVVNNLAYIADNASGLQIVDVSNPTKPVFKGAFDTPGFAVGVQVAGHTAYIADDSGGLQLIDVSNPAAPTLKGTDDSFSHAYAVQVLNTDWWVARFAYVVDLASGLTIVDVNNPRPDTPIFPKASYAILGASTESIQIVNNTAYISAGKFGLQLFDISNLSTLIGTANADFLAGGTASATLLQGMAGDDYLMGGSGDGADTLEGGAGNDILEGRGGADKLDGGSGNDTASYAAALAISINDPVIGQIEVGVNANLSTPTKNIGYTGGVLSDIGFDIDYSAGDSYISIENLTGSGFADKLTGNVGNNKLDGGLGNDKLNGGLGNDTLNGGLGNDTLNGGSGQDVLTGGGDKNIFQFTTVDGSDTIADFNVVNDTVQLENSVFKALSTTGTLTASMFRAGAGVTTAADANDYLIYNTNTGQLFYDADANGAGASLQIALIGLSKHAALSNADFVVT